jgi:hypothetical protein
MTEPREINWAQIEAAYRAGVKSLRQIGAEHGVTEGAIRKRANKEGWERDLAEKVRLKAEEKVRKEAVRNSVRESTRVPESVVLEVNSDLLAGVTLGHRKDISRFRSLGVALLEELERGTFSRELFEQLADLVAGPPITGTDPADKAAERRRQQLLESFEKTMSLPSRVDSMKKLADTLKTLIALEREAYGMLNDGNNRGAGTIEDWLDSLD